MDSCDTQVCYILLALTPVILQGFGVCGTNWVTATSCKALDDIPTCCKSDKSTCHDPFGLDDLHQGVYIMQVIAFMVLLIHFLCLLPTICCGCFDGPCKAFLEELRLYPIAGLLSLFGCIIIGNAYFGQSFGKSFGLCLASGLYVLFFTAGTYLQKRLTLF